ncbi:MAG: hypothetical protein ACOYI5_10700 [Christensenellales bacterium]|jgi:hypothetical protein
MENNRGARMPWIIVILIVVIVLLLSWLGSLILRNAMGKDDFGSYKAFLAADGAKVQTIGDGFIYYDGSTLARIQTSGDTKWQYHIGANAQFHAGDAGVAAWGGETLTLIDMATGVTTYTAAQGEAVASARMGAKYAAALIGSETDGTVVVMEPGGRQVYEVDFNQETVIDYGFFSAGSLLWVMALDTSGSVPTCEITTYKPGSKRIVGLISDTEQLMYHVTFQSSNICSTGVTYYKVYDYTGTENEARRKLVYGWALVAAEDADDPLMAFAPTGQSDGTAELKDVRMMRAGLDRIVRMPYACKALAVRGEHVYGFSQDGYVMVAASNSQDVRAYRMPFQIDKVFGLTGDGAAVVQSGGTIYMISLGT